jgi:hypothetical protein
VGEVVGPPVSEGEAGPDGLALAVGASLVEADGEAPAEPLGDGLGEAVQAPTSSSTARSVPARRCDIGQLGL